MNRARLISTVLILGGVIVLTLISGFTVTSFNADRDALLTDESAFVALPLSAVDRSILALSHALEHYLDHHVAHSEDMVSGAINNLTDSLVLLQQAPSLDENPVLLQYVQEATALEQNARAAFGEAAHYDDQKAHQIAQEANEILERFPNLVDDQVRKETLLNIEIYNRLESSTIRSLAISFLTMLMALLGMGYFIRLSAHNEALAARNSTLAQRAGALNDAKSQLLTLLSHEMRTPLNGIVGLSNVMMQTELDEDQRAMMEQLHGSALELTHVVTDMLDFADFATLSVDQQKNYVLGPFFFDALEKSLELFAMSLGRRFHLKFEGDIPPVFQTDSRRLFRALIYLISAVLRSGPDSEFTVDIRFTDFEMILKIDFHYLYDFDSDWRVEYLVEEPADNFNKIESEGMESTMARGLLESLGAKARVLQNEQDPKHHRLLIEIPVDCNMPDPFYIAKWCEDIEFPEALSGFLNAQQMPDTQDFHKASIIFASFKSNERGNVSCLREAAPHATIIGVVDVLDSEVYDYTMFVSPKEEMV